MAIAVSVGSVPVPAHIEQLWKIICNIAKIKDMKWKKNEENEEIIGVPSEICRNIFDCDKPNKSEKGSKTNKLLTKLPPVRWVYVPLFLLLALTSCSKTRMDYNRLEGEWENDKGYTIEFSERKDSLFTVTANSGSANTYQYFVDGKANIVYNFHKSNPTAIGAMPYCFNNGKLSFAGFGGSAVWKRVN